MALNITNFKLIYITGIDGSGKTTLAKKLENYFLSHNLDVRYFYARHFPILLKPFKLIASRLLLRKTDEFNDYNGYIEKKRQRSKRFRLFSSVYGGIWFLDYLIITHARMLRHLITRQCLIVDRYVYDILINISITLDLSDAGFEKIIKTGTKFFYEPSIIFFLDLPEEIAFQRKNDIQSIEYLTERRQKYLYLCDKMGWIKLDATRPQEAIQRDVINFLNK